jgi:hypothetical protein
MTGLADLRRSTPARDRYELLARHAHSAVCKALDMQAYYAAELEAGTVTTRDAEGVTVEVIYRSGDDVKRRLALRMGERDALDMQQRNMRRWNLCNRAAAQHATTRAWLQQLLQAAAKKAEWVGLTECAAREAVEAAATNCARSKRRQARPLAKCHASNAPNVLQVNGTTPRCAAMTTKEAAPT